MSTGSLADATEAQSSMTSVDDPPAQFDAAETPQVPRHPVVTVLLVGLPVLAFAAFGLSGRAVVTALAAAALVALAAIDIQHRLLPNRILLPAIAVVLIAQVAFFPDRTLEWVLAGVAAAAFLALPRVIRRDAMGMGDIKLAVLLGVATGWSVFAGIVIGCLAIVPVAIWMLFRDRSIRGATLPFGPFLAFGTLVILFTS